MGIKELNNTNVDYTLLFTSNSHAWDLCTQLLLYLKTHFQKRRQKMKEPTTKKVDTLDSGLVPNKNNSNKELSIVIRNRVG
jgi:hypothetical protein